MTRRDLLTNALLAAVAPLAPALAIFTQKEERLKVRLAELDKRSGGRLGCAVLNTANGAVIAHRGDERFPMCSTFKASAAAFVLQRVDRREERLDRRVMIDKRDLQSYSPITKLHVGETMTVEELCVAAATESDNTAANLLLASFGGPAALTRFWRSIGDAVTRLDNKEPELNDDKPGDPKDTASPVATVHNLRKLLFGDVLKPDSRTMLTKWLIANKTGDNRLRAGLPHGWVVGDKTGTGSYQTSNDIAVIWPTGHKPYLVAAYLTQGPSSGAARDAILADVGRAVADEIGSIP